MAELAKLHHRFLTIYPFMEGNCRVSAGGGRSGVCAGALSRNGEVQSLLGVGGVGVATFNMKAACTKVLRGEPG